MEYTYTPKRASQQPKPAKSHKVRTVIETLVAMVVIYVFAVVFLSL